jgi:hypothetical protein
MPISLRISTKIRKMPWTTDGRIAISVLVNDIDVMSWHQTADSVGYEPKFTAIAMFGHEEFRVFTPDFVWADQSIDGVETAAVEIPFAALPVAIDNAVDKMFFGASKLEIVPCEYGYSVIDPTQPHLGNQLVMSWNQNEWKAPFTCTGWIVDAVTEEVDEDEDETFELFEDGGRFTFGQVYKHDYGDSWDQQYIADITPHAYRAMREGWVR